MPSSRRGFFGQLIAAVGGTIVGPKALEAALVLPRPAAVNPAALHIIEPVAAVVSTYDCLVSRALQWLEYELRERGIASFSDTLLPRMSLGDTVLLRDRPQFLYRPEAVGEPLTEFAHAITLDWQFGADCSGSELARPLELDLRFIDTCWIAPAMAALAGKIHHEARGAHRVVIAAPGGPMRPSCIGEARAASAAAALQLTCWPEISLKPLLRFECLVAYDRRISVFSGPGRYLPR